MANSFSSITINGPHGGGTATIDQSEGNIAYLIDKDGQIDKVEGMVIVLVNPDNGDVGVFALRQVAGLDEDKGITIDVNWNS